MQIVILFMLCAVFLCALFLSTFFLTKLFGSKISALTQLETFDVSNYVLPKKIYCYWDTDLSQNEIINVNIESWKRNIPSEWEIIVLNKENVKNYADIEFLEKYQDLDPTKFSDFLRVYLLSTYGGCWMDAGIIVLNGEFLDQYYEEMTSNFCDICLYEYKVKTLDPKLPYLENWFIMSPKNGRLITDLYHEFAKSYQMGFVRYKQEILAPQIDLTNTLGNNDTDVYLMQHAIIQYLLHTQDKNKTNTDNNTNKTDKKPYCVNIKDASESMFKVQLINEWDHQKIIDFIINHQDWSEFYAIKLIGSNRNAITDQNRQKYLDRVNQFSAI